MKRKATPRSLPSPFAAVIKSKRAKAAARHVAPAGVPSMARDALMDHTPPHMLARHAAAVRNGHDNPEVFLPKTGPFCRAGRSTQVAQYAGGTYVQHLPKSKGHRNPAHRAARPS